MGYRGNLSKVPTVTHRTQVSPLSHSGDRGNLSLEFDVETFAKMGDRGDLCFPSGMQKVPRGNLSPHAHHTRWDTVETVYRVHSQFQPRHSHRHPSLINSELQPRALGYR